MVLMRGATLLRTGLLNFLVATSEEKRLQAVAQWDLGEDELPKIRTWYPYEVRSMRHREGPIAAINVASTGKFTRVDYSEVAEERYRIEYSARVYLWCYTPEGEFEDVEEQDQVRRQTTRVRDDLTAVIRSALLGTPSLGNEEAFYFQEETLSENYSALSPVPNASGRMVAASYLDFKVQFDESQFAIPVGAVPPGGISIVVDRLPMIVEVTS